MSTVIDYTPLHRPVPAAEVASFRQRARASGASWASHDVATIIGFLLVIPIALVIVGMAGTVGVMVMGALGVGALVPVVIGGLFFLALLGVLVFAGLRGALGGGRWEHWARLDRFARANGLLFSPRTPRPDYPGAIFGIGDGRHAVDHFRTTTGRFLDFGDYRYTTGSGKNRRTHTWGFLAVHLDRRLPHMVLDSRANNGLFGATNLPAVFDRSQVLSLEGDFDRFFTLYCPRQYERDALYVFTPDLMALLIDEAAPFDVEIVDDWMFVYASGGFGSGNAATYERLFRIVETVGMKTVSRTGNYRDERVPAALAADVVAPHGARLKRGVSIGGLLVVAGVALTWGWLRFGEFLLP